MDDLSVILLAGGKGSRMKSQTPKQFLQLGGKAMILHSLDVLCAAKIADIVIVADLKYRHFFEGYDVRFALPGVRRQDSVKNGLLECQKKWICVHDGARPFITTDMLQRLFWTGKKIGAAATGVPVKSTMKECCEKAFVKKTLNRSLIWEIQTPQIVAKELLLQGFEKAEQEKLTVTDDVSLAELVNHPVQIVEGDDRNLKITSPEDLIIARRLCEI